MAHPSELHGSNAASSLTYLHIPDMLVDWSWQRKINPLYEEVAAEGDAWFRSFLALTPKSQRAFETIKPSLMAALLFPDVSCGKGFNIDVLTVPQLTAARQTRPVPHLR